ncbi:hypothetical protein FA95DRAFT_1454082, partial [Auriscalpium vulgare]
RCVDCLHRSPLCRECLLDGHRWLPFHRVEEWLPSERFWQRTTLSKLGLVLNLGHGGLPCKTFKTRGDLREMTIVHGRGIERIQVKFCACIQGNARMIASDFDQLMDCDLFPASWVRPMTAFTLAVMKDFQLLALQTQAPAGDLMRYLARSSDNIDPDDVDDRYREYMISQREFAYLSATKRANEQPRRDMNAGSLAVLCPACPQPGINMDPHWQTREDDLRFLDAMYYATDGNFHLNQKIKPMDMADTPLTMGAAYFAHEGDYAKFLPRVPPRKEPEETTCHEFGALGYGAHTGKVSGVVGLYCQRHMFALAGGLVDLQKGERFANVDYVMLTALQPYMDLTTHVSGYDINCQYRINLEDRLKWMRENTADLGSIQKYRIPLTLAAVGKFHLPAHCASCRIFFSFHFLPWCAMTDGEAAERLWAILNSIGNATREMTPGNRHDFINAMLSDLNARRVHGIAKYLARKHNEAAEALVWVREELELVEREAKEAVIEWRKKLATWQADVLDIKKHKDMSNPFEPEKSAAATSGKPGDRLSAFMLDDEQAAAGDEADEGRDSGKRKQSEDVEGKQAGTKQKQTKKVAGQDATDDRGDGKQDKRLQDEESKPARSRRARKEVTNGEMLGNVRDRRVLLPSCFNKEVIEHASMTEAADIERGLREGQCNDALDALDGLRVGLISSYSFTLYKKESKHTQGMATRTKTMDNRKRDTIDQDTTTYRRARQARIALGMSETDEDCPRLKKEDIKSFTVYTADAKLGESRRQTSWIWSKFENLLTSKNKSLSTWTRSALKALWFRRTSLYKRWWEESLLVNEEMRRVRRTFEHFRDSWLDTAHKSDASDPGRAAYARR